MDCHAGSHHDFACPAATVSPLTFLPPKGLHMPDQTTAVVDQPERRSKGRRLVIDRRGDLGDASVAFTGQERRSSDRRKTERRRQIDPTTCERDYQPEEVEFMRAMDDYKRRSGRQFPTWSEVLEVIRDLGYRKVAPPTRTFEAAKN